ncbi:MAG: response regulator transcription factor [Fibrobacteria bacterium]|nr:response regulator transcription factor [Fibrobacteria bacterium]
MDPNSLPTVVLADDEPHIRMLMKTVLTRAGFKVAGEARNGREAIEMCKEHRPGIVLLDINMPLVSGEEALPDILASTPGVAVIMLTSITDRTTVERCFDMGAANYLRKDTPVQEIGSQVLATWKEWNEPASEGEP